MCMQQRGGVVGVFKISSCGTYKELRISMDCEDKRDNSYTTGNVGATYIEMVMLILFSA